jgi:DNA/RNA endonuclease YhcR with UshA esterase domain
MGDATRHIALATSIAGLMILAVVHETLEPPYTAIEDLNAGFIGKNVHITGSVRQLHTFKGGSILITLCNTDSDVDVFLPYQTSSQITFKPAINQSLDVIGTIESYNGRLEVVVEKQSSIRLTEDENKRLKHQGV